MNRTITVKGTGHVSIAPDCVELALEITRSDPVYENAMSAVSEAIASLAAAIAPCGFTAKDLKTVDFDVRSVDRSVKEKSGSYRYVFDHYECKNRLKLSFDLDSERLSGVLSAIAACSADPRLSIRFTVKDPANAGDALLRDACVNGTRKARILCEASGAKLGQLLRVDYNWGELDIYSHTRFEPIMDCCELSEAPAFSANITPEDIDLSDTVTLVWELA